MFSQVILGDQNTDCYSTCKYHNGVPETHFTIVISTEDLLGVVLRFGRNEDKDIVLKSYSAI